MRAECVSFLQNLRQEIIAAFEGLETDKHFQKIPWEHHTGGGGEIGLLRGAVFEKAAVNWSGVSGEQFPTSEAKGPFFATGISLITHMSNPFAPTVHFNLRYIETASKSWFGGGYDLTPMGFPFAEDTQHFHHNAKTTLDTYDKGLYTQFSQAAAHYFYIPHRKKERGVGGIFFDHWNSGNQKADFSLWKAIGTSFLAGILPIYKRRIAMPFTQKEKELQQKMRAHYVEFNLIYDRGTKFGFQSGGNPEAILCSLPPYASW